MPQSSSKTARDRAEGQNVNVHPRANGDLILQPDDLLEGLGNFTSVDSGGNPEGFRLGQPPERDGWHVYEGPQPDQTTRQTTSTLPAERPSFLFSQPSVRGHAIPTKLIAEKVPRPLAPLVKKEPAARIGYPASTFEKPYWFAWSIAVRRGGGFVHTMLSPFTACEPNGNGQGFRVPLPPREAGEYAGLWLTQPGTSTASRTGPVREQRVVRIADHPSGFYDLTGPYRYTARLAPTRNETSISRPGAARFRFERERVASRPGIFRCAASFASPGGEGPAGPYSGPLTIRSSDYYREDENDENPPGYGQFKVYRPSASAGATGWYAYVETGGSVYRIYNKTTGQGLRTPLPLSWSYIESAGWEGSEKFAQNDTNLLASASLPEANASGLAAPDSAPETPLAFGAVLPEPGRRYIRVTDTYRGRESLPSEPVRVDLGAGEIMRVVYRSPVNQIPNASYIETDPDDLPFDHIVRAPAGAARVVSGEMVMEVLPGQEAAEYSESTESVRVDPSKEWSLGAEFAVEEPMVGVMNGVFESVLVEEDASGAVLRETVLYSTSEAGEHEYYLEVAPSTTAAPDTVTPDTVTPDTASLLLWHPQVWAARLVHRILSAVGLKNLKTRTRRKHFKDHPGRPRPTKPAEPKPGRPPIPGRPSKPDPKAPPPGGGGSTIAPPPRPPAPPPPPPAAVRPVQEPDRPRSEGEVLEDLGGFSDGIPPGWQIDKNADATALVSSQAAISDPVGLLLRDTTTTVQGRANIFKVFSAEGRHDSGIFSRNRMADMPVSGSVRMHPLSTPEGRDVAWLEIGAEGEAASLTITEGPKLPGIVSVILDGARTDLTVEAVKEVATLTVTGAPTSYGNVTVRLDGAGKVIPTGGEKQVVSLTVQTPRHDGQLVITLDGERRAVKVFRSQSSSDVAARIRRQSFPGWRVSGSRNQVIFEATAPGPKGLCSYDRSTSATPGSLAVATPGANETASELASRIRATAFPGWRTGGSGSSVTFTAVYAGTKADATFSMGTTGTTATMTTTTQGSSETASALAARIRAATFGGWVVGGSGAVVTFTATTQGNKRGAYFDAGATQARASVVTTVEGREADLFCAVKDADGDVTRRKIMSTLLETDVWEIDLAVSGAGTDEAIVSVWGAIGNTPRQLLARFEEVDLSGLLVGKKTLGVVSESTTQTIWELHVDDALVTNRGRVYHRDHDHAGHLISQLHGYFVPGQPVRDDLFLQGPGEGGQSPGKRIAVLPNRSYTVSAFVRYRGVARLAKPLCISAVLANGQVGLIGDVTGAGVVRRGGWTEYTRLVSTPPGCHELRIRSTGIGAGEIIVQELVVSPGEAARRTGLYATEGSHTATLNVGTARNYPGALAGRKRSSLEVDVADEAERPATEVMYRSGRILSGPYSGWTPDSQDVPQRPVVQVRVSMSGNGLSTPELRSGFPRAEYDVVLGRLPLMTLLKADRSELTGGAFFGEIEEWTNRTRVGVRELPSGRLQRRALFDPAGHFPASVIHVFTPEAKTYLEERWGLELFCIEAKAWGEMAWIKPAGQIEFASEGWAETPEGRFALYSAPMAACEVVQRRPLP